MRKLSEVYNEDALDILADIIEPATSIFADPELRKAWESGEKKVKLVAIAIKNHKSDAIDALAILDGIPREKYKTNLIKMTKDLLELLNDKELSSFFTSSELTEGQTVSGSATENIEANEK